MTRHLGKVRKSKPHKQPQQPQQLEPQTPRRIESPKPLSDEQLDDKILKLEEKLHQMHMREKELIEKQQVVMENISSLIDENEQLKSVRRVESHDAYKKKEEISEEQADHIAQMILERLEPVVEEQELPPPPIKKPLAKKPLAVPHVPTIPIKKPISTTRKSLSVTPVPHQTLKRTVSKRTINPTAADI